MISGEEGFVVEQPAAINRAKDFIERISVLASTLELDAQKTLQCTEQKTVATLVHRKRSCVESILGMKPTPARQVGQGRDPSFFRTEPRFGESQH
jgi:hypothetical protein